MEMINTLYELFTMGDPSYMISGIGTGTAMLIGSIASAGTQIYKAEKQEDMAEKRRRQMKRQAKRRRERQKKIMEKKREKQRRERREISENTKSKAQRQRGRPSMLEALNESDDEGLSGEGTTETLG